MTDLKKQIDELAGIKADMSKLKARKDKLEAEIIMQCSEDLENTKYKSVHYAGTESELTAVTSESLKITYNSFCSQFLAKHTKMRLRKRQNIPSLLRQKECSSVCGRAIL